MIDLLLIGVILFLINFGIGGILYFYTNLSLFFYIKKTHYKRWESHRLVHGYPLTANPLKTISYIFNNQDVKDKRVLNLKKRVRFWIIYTVISALMIIIWTIIGPLIERLT
mgnify:CR=1 FL=1